jgi:hypothetical protein
MSSSVRQRLTASLARSHQGGKGGRQLYARQPQRPALRDLGDGRGEDRGQRAHGRPPSVRTLGYRHFKDLKADLKQDIGDAPWLIGDRLKDFRARSGRRAEAPRPRARAGDRRPGQRLRDGADQGMETGGENDWRGFPASMSRASRPSAESPSSSATSCNTCGRACNWWTSPAATFVDVLLEAPKHNALVLFEARRYSRLALDLAREARRAKIPTTLITDIYCNWGHELVDEMFVIPTEFNMFWESTAQMASFSNLMINEIFKELGPAVEKRYG